MSSSAYLLSSNINLPDPAADTSKSIVWTDGSGDPFDFTGWSVTWTVWCGVYIVKSNSDLTLTPASGFIQIDLSAAEVTTLFDTGWHKVVAVNDSTGEVVRVCYGRVESPIGESTPVYNVTYEPRLSYNRYTTPGNYVWTKPVWCDSNSVVEIIVVSGGGGGGSGRRGAAGTVRTGGGAGAPAQANFIVVSAAALNATENVTVGAGGAGGAAVTSNDTDGNGGASGHWSYVGTRYTDALITAYPGGGAQGGKTTPGYGGTSYSQYGTFAEGHSAGPYSDGSGGAGRSPETYASGPHAGGSGGGITSGDTANNGGTVNRSLAMDNGSAGASYGDGGVVDGSSPTASNSVARDARPSLVTCFGGGGGGGAASITQAAQAGADGLQGGGGGGGGGASLNGYNSGAGGAGGDGYVEIIVRGGNPN